MYFNTASAVDQQASFSTPLFARASHPVQGSPSETGDLMPHHTSRRVPPAASTQLPGRGLGMHDNASGSLRSQMSSGTFDPGLLLLCQHTLAWQECKKKGLMMTRPASSSKLSTLGAAGRNDC